LINGRNRMRGINLLAAVDKVHPHEPHWYLALLGTDPLVQGRGAGGRLLQPVLNIADNDGVLTYLETQKPENIAFYSRHGFTVADEISIEGSPTVWTMRREPR
jgi:GNAT superfamily N-acetyltransferase